MNVIIANLGVAAAALLLMLLRKIMKNRISPRLFAAMWFLILLRVLVPVEVTTHISVFTPPQKTAIVKESSFEHEETGFENFEHDTVTVEHEPVQNGAQLQEKQPEVKKSFDGDVLFTAYVCVAAAFALYFVAVHTATLHRCNRMEHCTNAAAVKILRQFDKKGKTAILQSDKACAPFSTGLFKPKIVLPPEYKNEQLEYIIAHEYTHIRHGDAVIRLLGVAALCAGWFNPFVWISFRYLDRDLERFCDDETLKLLGVEHAPRYAITILDFAEMQSNSYAAQSFATPPLEERVMDILNIRKRKTSKLLSMLAVAAMLFAMTACGTTAVAAETEKEDEQQDYEYVWMVDNQTPVGHKTVQEKYSVDHHFYRPITGETMCTLEISMDYSFDGLSSTIDDYKITRKVEDGYVLFLSQSVNGDTLTIDATVKTADEKIFVHDIITVKTYPDSNVIKDCTDERTSDEEIRKINSSESASRTEENESTERVAYPTYDRKWDFYDIFTDDYARPTKDSSKVMWDGVGYVYIYGIKGEDIYATKSGTVKELGCTTGGYGNILIIEHDDGTAAAYYHLKEILVDIGDEVEQGDVIATLGSSGNANAPMCGFEIFENDMAIMHPEETVGVKDTLDEFVNHIFR